MKLPYGVTGFYETNHRQPPKMNGQSFKGLCFTLIMHHGGRILDFHEPQVTNFFEVVVDVFHQRLHLLLNKHYPLFACASWVEYQNMIFMDEPRLSEAFRPYYQVLGTQELNEPLYIQERSGEVVVKNENELNRAELQQIAYWKPKSIGEVLFHFWD